MLAVVQPDRNPVGAKEAGRAVAEDFETRAEVESRRHASREVLQEYAHLALKVRVALQAKPLERRDERVGDRCECGLQILARRIAVDPDDDNPEWFVETRERP